MKKYLLYLAPIALIVVLPFTAVRKGDYATRRASNFAGDVEGEIRWEEN